MRLVTRCPACTTTFKVVRDQLRISEGWVRCGRCSEVFDATLDLQEVDEDGNAAAPTSAAAGGSAVASPMPAHRPPQENLLPVSSGLPAMDWPAADLLDLGAKPPAAPAVAPAPTPAVSNAAAPAPFSPENDPVPIPSLDVEEEGGKEPKEPWFDDMMASTQALQAALQSAAATPELASSAFGESSRREPGFAPSLTAPSLTTPSPIEQAVDAQVRKALRRERIKALRQERAQQKERERGELAPARQDVPSAAQAPEASRPTDADALATADTVRLEAPSAPASFEVDVDITQPAPRSRMRRVMLALCCLLALAALLAQVARHERDVLAAREPRLRPALQALCNWTGCELSAVRQIASITIDGASFSREKEGDGYRLVFTLRNSARMPLAMPSIELTLLDTQERALVRRVLSPSQFGAGAVLGPGGEHNSALPVQLAGSEAAGLAPVAGYRLIAFYP